MITYNYKMVFGFKKKREDYDINDLQSLKTHIENKFSSPVEEKLRTELSDLRYQLNVEKENSQSISQRHEEVQRDLLSKERKIAELEKEIEALKVKKPIRAEVKKNKKINYKKDSRQNKISDIKSKLDLVSNRIKDGN